MGLEQVLKVSLDNLQPGVLHNEAQIKSAVILPILDELGWKSSIPNEFKAEFEIPDPQTPNKKRWVDYALGNLPNNNPRPLVFVEAKSAGRVDTKGEEQLFSYAVNRGVPLLVLTDGTIWNFYLSMASGPPHERCFYRMELRLREKIPEYEESFQRYLLKDNVFSGQSQSEAEKKLKRDRDQEVARNAIAPCWDALLREADPVLRDALVEAVTEKCGVKPDLDLVESFLRDLAGPQRHEVQAVSRHREIKTNPDKESKDNLAVEMWQSGKTYKEIAEALGVSVGAVYRRVNRLVGEGRINWRKKTGSV